MPHFHQGTDDPFGLAVGLWAVDLGELLADVVAFASLDKGMLVSAPVLLAVVGVGVVDLVRALGNDVADQELGGAVLGLVGQDVGVAHGRSRRWRRTGIPWAGSAPGP